MGKRQIFKRQQINFMILNLIAFTIIFSIFGIIVFSQVQRTLFSQTDEELMRFKEMLEEQAVTEFRLPSSNMNLPPNERLRNEPNPRIIVLNWNSSGKIMNENRMGTLFYESYLQDYQLDTSTVDTITNMSVNDAYNFRYLLFKDVNENDEIAYTQLMINIDAEKTIIEHFGELLIICSSIFIILSISASYFLSKKMMNPIIHSWNKQTEFVENASHELRTPLTIIQNKLELLLTNPHEKIMDKFENIALSLSETRRLTKLTTDLLTLARADASETELVKTAIMVDDFIEKICEPYIEIAESQNKHFSLNLNTKTTIEADETRLHQLFVILLDNALKYTGHGDYIKIQSSVSDNKIVIDVMDTGVGIKEENKNLIFERFYREDQARSRETGGSGLGLSIAQWIVKKHNGSISASQNHPKGTTFTIKLPIQG
ncbi:sensor histidine kinase [Robertmurraya massiliosenegalensis]|uniref:sensor histidine kinase n=1 Tax=Robertmurraya massiliosenegalensis TaxID=1287657 RepID=UPI0003020937|nr:HAMP domain-containing sensor histidine kinase [Robertmurraya massiliosenegalensis]